MACLLSKLILHHFLLLLFSPSHTVIVVVVINKLTFFLFTHNNSYHFRKEDYQQAYAAMQELRQRSPNVNMAYYVNVASIEAIHRALGIPMGRGLGAEGADEVDDDMQV